MGNQLPNATVFCDFVYLHLVLATLIRQFFLGFFLSAVFSAFYIYINIISILLLFAYSNVLAAPPQLYFT